LPVESVPLPDSWLMMMIGYDVKTCQFGVIGSSLAHISIQWGKEKTTKDDGNDGKKLLMM
jgi:hypothetical protein